eukprot:6699763-Ditylum_brightwellii.AAC.1
MEIKKDMKEFKALMGDGVNEFKSTMETGVKDFKASMESGDKKLVVTIVKNAVAGMTQELSILKIKMNQ